MADVASTGAAAGSGRKRTLGLAALAAVLTLLTFYDYTRGISDRTADRVSGGTGERTALRGSAAPVGPAQAPPANAAAVPVSAANAAPWSEVARLRHLRDHAAAIRERYQAIAVPYAEAVAGFATLYAPGQQPREQATQAIRALLPPEIEIRDMLLADAEPARQGVVFLNATISLASADSQAMARALARLGDAASGMAWKELSAGIDGERRTVSAKGQLLLVMVPHAE